MLLLGWIFAYIVYFKSEIIEIPEMPLGLETVFQVSVAP